MGQKRPVPCAWLAVGSGRAGHDPIFEAGGISLYGFVGNNPMMFVDPCGLYSFGEWLQIGGAFCQGAGEGLNDTLNPIPIIVENQDRLADAFVDGDTLIVAGALSAAVGDAILLGSGRGKGKGLRAGDGLKRAKAGQ